MKRDKKTAELFRELIDIPDFKSEIKEIRSYFGLSKKYSSKNITEDSWNEIVSECFILSKKMNLPSNIRALLPQYILDENVLEKPLQHPDHTAHKIKTVLFKDKWLLNIYPGAVKADAIRLIREAWPYDSKGVKRIRTKVYRGRDKEIIKMYELGLFKADGNFKTGNAKEFLQKEGVDVGYRFTEFRAELEKIFKIKLPNSDAIRKVIFDHKAKK